jgi:hypothetical protein
MKVCKLMSIIESGTERDLGDSVWFWCPGCEGYHSARVRMPNEPTEQEIADQKANIHGLWTWNGNEEKPTIRASILVGANRPEWRCHSYVTNGNIEFQPDCFHELKGQTVGLTEFDL